jgi:hypothetical protein
MKKHVLLLAGLFLMSLASFGQAPANLVVFSEDGDLFFAYVNGIRQNDKPEANVKVTGLTFPNVSLRIEFNDKALPQLKQNMMLEPGYEHTAKIVRDMKKVVKLKYFGQAPIDNSAAPAAGTVAYHSSETPTYNTAPADDNNNSSTTVTSTTTSTTYNSSNPGNASINVNMNGTGVNMNVNGMDPNAHGNVMTTTSSTTVSSSSSSSSQASHGAYSHGSSSHHHNDKATASSTSSNAGCRTPMSTGNFVKMKHAVESKPFSDTKMSTAKAATRNACLSVSQVKEICKLFSMDDEKLAYAKFAYDYSVDKANYYQVSEVFSFSGTTEDFNQFLEQR